MARAKTPKTPKTNGNGVRRKKVETNGPWPVTLEEQIRVRAYELFEQRAGGPGSEHEDWLLAEQQVKARHATAGN